MSEVIILLEEQPTLLKLGNNSESCQNMTVVKDSTSTPIIMDRQCNKDFPSVSIGGCGYMFLWFCGQHGHCYGFHLISGGEGRKDPFCSLYKYMKDMPKDVFYDFTCNLSEYALNREPDLFFPLDFGMISSTASHISVGPISSQEEY